MFERNLHRSI